MTTDHRLSLAALAGVGALLLSGCGLLPGDAEPTNPASSSSAEAGAESDSAEPSDDRSGEPSESSSSEDRSGESSESSASDDRGAGSSSSDASRGSSSGGGAAAGRSQDGEAAPAEQAIRDAIAKTKAADSAVVRAHVPLDGVKNMLTVEGPLDGSEAKSHVYRGEGVSSEFVEIVAADGEAYARPFGNEGTQSLGDYRLLDGKYVQIDPAKLPAKEMTDAGALLDLALQPLEDLSSSDFEQFTGRTEDSSVYGEEVMRYSLPNGGGSVVITPDGTVGNVAFGRTADGNDTVSIEKVDEVPPVELPDESTIAR